MPDASLCSHCAQPLPESGDLCPHCGRSASSPEGQANAAEADTEATAGVVETEAGARLDRHVARQHVAARQACIVDAMRRHDLEQARSAMAALVEFQLGNGDARFAVKSLCNMAAQAQRRGLRALQDAWTAEAVKIGPEDGWALRQRGKTLLDLGQLDEALRSYDHAIVLEGDGVAHRGRAEVLKAMGRFDDALAAYSDAARHDPADAAIRGGRVEILMNMGRFDDALGGHGEAATEPPEDGFAGSDVAEMLRSMGRFDEALAAYDQALLLQPQNPVLGTGRAEVLKAMGRFDEALAAYERTARLQPQSNVAKSGRAEMLKAMGYLDDALVAYDDLTRQHPENVIAKNRRACVLAALGRSKEALRALPQLESGNAAYWVTLHARGLILLRIGRTGEAIRLFENAILTCPLAASLPYFRTGLAVLRLQQGRPAAAAELLAHPTTARLAIVTSLLRAHASGALGRLDEATALYRQTPRAMQAAAGDIADEVRRRYVDRRSSARDEAWLIRCEIEALLVLA
jgi:tetratricopeptide (TPR) repeat protein